MSTELIFMVLVFFTVALLAAGLVAAFQKDAVSQRMEREITSAAAKSASSLLYGAPTGRFSSVWGKLERFAGAKDDKDKTTLRLKLVRAGYYNPRAVAIYYGLRIAMAIGFALMVTVAIPTFSGGLIPLNIVPVVGIAFAGLGYILPFGYITQRIRERQLAVQESFPDGLDMMLICVEAGLGLGAAMERVGLELEVAHPVLSEHFKLIGLETRAGKSRGEALKNFANRTGVDEVRSLVTLLHQSQQLGTNMADSLRVHAFEMRAKRLLRAEERANKLPVKIVLPLGFGILPCLLIVIFTPILIRIFHAMGATG